MPIKPAPSTAFSTSRSASPMTLLMAIMPANPPDSSMAIIVMRTAPMPAYFAARWDLPKDRISRPRGVRQISSHTSTQAIRAMTSDTLAGAALEKLMPIGASISCSDGRCTASSKRAVAGSMLPAGRRTLTSM